MHILTSPRTAHFNSYPIVVVSCGPVTVIYLPFNPSTECAPYNGWARCQMLADPKIKIVGSKNVSQSAMDVVAGIYADITALFSEEYPKDKFDGYVIYITNGEPWSELSGLHPVGTMWPDQEGTSSWRLLAWRNRS